MGKLKLGQAKINKNLKQDEYEKARKELENDFIQDMADSAIDIEISKEEQEKTKKKYKKLKIKKIVLYIALITFIFSIIIFGVYKTFFEHKYTGPEIAKIANNFNNKTNFPESGVQGYLESNINKLLKEKVTINSQVTEMSIGIPVVTRINSKNDNLANVYFYTPINSNTGKEIVNCVLPIYWNDKTQLYAPAGDIILTPNAPTNIDTNKVKNELLSFENIAKEDDTKIESSKTFINNFFTMLYSGQDISPYYNGQVKLESNGLKYDGMSEYMLYKEKNKNGYNASVKITLTTKNGVSYITEKYLTISKTGESWIVNAVL